MKAIKTPDQFPEMDYEDPRNVARGRETEGFILLCDAGFEFVDGEDKHWQNTGDTLVMAVPTEVSQYHVLPLMSAIANLKPDEFEIQPLDGVEGFDRIVRIWWD